jgi:hypothetical protein
MMAMMGPVAAQVVRDAHVDAFAAFAYARELGRTRDARAAHDARTAARAAAAAGHPEFQHWRTQHGLGPPLTPRLIGLAFASYRGADTPSVQAARAAVLEEARRECLPDGVALADAAVWLLHQILEGHEAEVQHRGLCGARAQEARGRLLDGLAEHPDAFAYVVAAFALRSRARREGGETPYQQEQAIAGEVFAQRAREIQRGRDAFSDDQRSLADHLAELYRKLHAAERSLDEGLLVAVRFDLVAISAAVLAAVGSLDRRCRARVPSA